MESSDHMSRSYRGDFTAAVTIAVTSRHVFNSKERTASRKTVGWEGRVGNGCTNKAKKIKFHVGLEPTSPALWHEGPKSKAITVVLVPKLLYVTPLSSKLWPELIRFRPPLKGMNKNLRNGGGGIFRGSSVNRQFNSSSVVPYTTLAFLKVYAWPRSGDIF